MRTLMNRLAIGTGLGAVAVMPAVTLVRLYCQGQQFALRNPLQHADAIVALAGTRGNIAFLDGKVRTAAQLYHQGWAPRIVFSGRFSRMVTDSPQLIPRNVLEQAASEGRVEQKDVGPAAETWDAGLDATYMRAQAIQLGVPEDAILVEDQSLHTLDNATFTAAILREYQMRRIILVTSPFHQLRTYLTFAKVLKPEGMEIINYYADSGDWHPLTWFLTTENRRLIASEQSRIDKYLGNSCTRPSPNIERPA
jgi:uncharacterized SAM-binding protein YcdF (DUF218 family)